MLLSIVLALVPAGEPLARERVLRCGYLSWQDTGAHHETTFKVFNEGPRKAGFVQGRNRGLMHRSAPNDAERFKPLARELAARKGNMLFADTPIRAQRAKHVELCLKRWLPLVWRGGACLDAALIDKLHRSTQLELAVNRKGARALGITIPCNLLGSADEEID